MTARSELWDELMRSGERVRVWDGPKSSIRAEGTLIGYIECPTLVIRDDDGVIHHEASSLPFEVARWGAPT